jgi:uncharacterized membrane protein (DUF485 family)
VPLVGLHLREFKTTLRAPSTGMSSLHTPGGKAMQQPSYHSIAENPKFQELVRSRSAFAWTLTIIMLAVYQGFIMLVAFAPGFLATPLYEGSVATIGIPIGIAVIVFAFLITGLYVLRANGHYDALNREVIQEITK